MSKNWISKFDHSSRYVDLTRLSHDFPELNKAPVIIQILAENLVRHGAGPDEITRLLRRRGEVEFRPYRVIMQDAAGLPALLDVAGLRDHAVEVGLAPESVELSRPAHLIVDHSIRTAFTGRSAAAANLKLEYEENAERFSFLRWAEQAFENLTVIPPGNGIIHQINLETIGSVVVRENGLVFPDTVIGTDSHTPMINGLGVLGWGVGGLEATAVLLGQPIQLPPPRIVGVHLQGRLGPGILMTDVVLRLTERLRAEGVVDCFLEFFGGGVSHLGVPDRATLSNMTPEFGATVSLFPPDSVTLAYLRRTGRTKQAAMAAHYLAKQPLLSLRPENRRSYDRTVMFDLSEVRPTVSGPFLPHQAHDLAEIPATVDASSKHGEIADGDIVIAAIASCTITSNPASMVAAGLLARNALERGMRLPARIKASFSPGSRAVASYLDRFDLLESLEELGFNLAGFGCMTCVGNSGDLDETISHAVRDHKINVAAVLSGNRNFEGRVHPLVRSNYLASPPLVIAYALAGSMRIDIGTEAIATVAGKAVHLRDIWPDQTEINGYLARLTLDSFWDNQADAHWKNLRTAEGATFPWPPDSSYLVRPHINPLLPGSTALAGAKALLLLGDSVTTDHISPVGRIVPESPAGRYLTSLGVKPADFNTYGSRRGNATVMRYGTFANPRLRNALVLPAEGWYTKVQGSPGLVTIPDAATTYAQSATSLVIVAGENYGTGSARDWAAKGTAALGVRAVLALSFERIHRTNLALVGVLPVEWRERPDLDGEETYHIDISPESVLPGCSLLLRIERDGRAIGTFAARCRLDTPAEVEIWRRGGFLASRLNIAA